MTPRTFSDDLVRTTPVLHGHDTVDKATRTLLDTDLPALPVVDSTERYMGIYGEREFMAAAFPGYLKELKYAGFVSHSLNDALERNEACRQEPISKHLNAEHIDVSSDYSDIQIAETFLHHRVLVVPVVDDGRVRGVVTRGDFFDAVAQRLLGRGRARPDSP